MSEQGGGGWHPAQHWGLTLSSLRDTVEPPCFKVKTEKSFQSVLQSRVLKSGACAPFITLYCFQFVVGSWCQCFG
jgi:hypothetical protein